MDDKYAHLEFPVGGVDKTQEFQEQPPGTTPDAENVRATDPDTLRVRGASRPGLEKYISTRATETVIQHLNVIVDPQAPYLPQNFTVPGDDWVEDPLNPGTFVPPGGWGVQPNPNATQPSQPSTGQDITFYQVFRRGNFEIDSEQTYNFELNFDLEVQIGHTILVAVLSMDSTTGSHPDQEATVTNLSGESYTRVGSALGNEGYNRGVSGGINYALSLWYKRVAEEDDKTVKISLTDLSEVAGFGPNVAFHMVEYDNIDTPATLGDFSFDSGSATTTLTTGQFDSGGAKYMAMAAYAYTPSDAAGFTPHDGFTQRGALAGNNGPGIAIIDDVDIGLSLNLDVTSALSEAVDFVSIGASFQPE